MQNKPFVEDIIFSNISVGPTIRRDYLDKIFTVSFPDASVFVDDQAQVKISHEKYKTIGDHHRGIIHERLDEFIDELIQYQELKNAT